MKAERNSSVQDQETSTKRRELSESYKKISKSFDGFAKRLLDGQPITEEEMRMLKGAAILANEGLGIAKEVLEGSKPRPRANGHLADLTIENS